VGDGWPRRALFALKQSLREPAVPERGKNIRPHFLSWPKALRAVRAWLAPFHWLIRCWTAWAQAPPPPELATLLEAVGSGAPINLYLPN
jgi:hypothetical protein